MLNIVKEVHNDVLTVRLSGQIEETVVFETLFGPLPAEVHVSCKEVRRINSSGVKNWMRYFQNARASGTHLKLQECSTAIVEQINLVSNFSCGADIESIYVPFSCVQCKSELVGLFPTEDLKKLQLKLPDLTCSKCGGKAVFDDLPEEYFAFLMR